MRRLLLLIVVCALAGLACGGDEAGTPSEEDAVRRVSFDFYQAMRVDQDYLRAYSLLSEASRDRCSPRLLEGSIIYVPPIVPTPALGSAKGIAVRIDSAVAIASISYDNRDAVLEERLVREDRRWRVDLDEGVPC